MGVCTCYHIRGKITDTNTDRLNNTDWLRLRVFFSLSRGHFW